MHTHFHVVMFFLLFVLGFILVAFLLGCQPPPLQGPEADLREVSAPVMPPQAPPVPPLVSAPPAPQGSFRAWQPRQVQPGGVSVEGHYVTIPIQAPAQGETLEPSVVVPRVPRPGSQPIKPSSQTSTPTVPPTPLPPSSPLPSPTSGAGPASSVPGWSSLPGLAPGQPRPSGFPSGWQGGH